MESMAKEMQTHDSLINKGECGKDNKDRIWWVQAEAVIPYHNEECA